MSDRVAGLLLAGGRSRRFEGGDKWRAELDGETLFTRILGVLRPQVRLVVLSANGDLAPFAEYDLPIVRDAIEDAGPLAGILAGLDWTRANLPGVPWVLSVPTDIPFLPGDLARRMVSTVEREGKDMACAASGGNTHPALCLWPVALADPLRAALLYEGTRKVGAWAARYRVSEVSWPATPVDPFFNINTAEDLETARRLIS